MKETVLDCDFLILNRIPGLYTAQRFQSEISRLKLNAALVTPEWLVQNTSQFETRGLGLGILYRQGDFNFWSTQSALMKMPFRFVNKPNAFLKARDKWLTAQEWTKQNIPMPRTCLLTSFANDFKVINAVDIFHRLQDVFGLPFMIKKRFSSQGHGVFLIHDQSSFISLIENDTELFAEVDELERDYFNIESLTENSDHGLAHIQLRRWLAQECIHESLGADIRVFTIQSQKFAISRRNEKSFKSNLHQGGKPLFTKLSSVEIEFCQKIHAHSELHYSGIDFLRTSTGPRFLEINPSPGFEGIETIYQENIAEKLINELRSFG